MIYVLMMSFSAFAEQRKVAYKVTKGQTSLSLYAMTDIHVVNKYLEQYGLEAVEVAPGFALTGVSVNYYKKGSVEFTGVPFKVGNYTTTYLPFLVKKPGSPLKSVYYFSETTTDGTFLRTVYGRMGINLYNGVFENVMNIADVQGSQHFATVHTKKCKIPVVSCQKELQLKIKAGMSDKHTWAKNPTFKLSENSIVSSPAAEGTFKYSVSSFDFSGTQYTREFDPKVDTYKFGEKTLQAKLFKEGGFIPTVWQYTVEADTVGYDSERVETLE